MYRGGLIFSISKSFGELQLIPEPAGLRFHYYRMQNGERFDSPSEPGYLDLLVPIDAVGGIWATTRAFLYGVESLDENVILQGDESKDESDTLIKLYRDKPRGQHGRLTGEETCWLRLVTGRSEEDRRRIKLGPRDLLCIELACTSVLSLVAQSNTHSPQHFVVQG